MVTVMANKKKQITHFLSFSSFIAIFGSVPLSATGGEWTITPTITVNETATDNVALTATREKNDWITDISPGIRIDGQGGRARLNLEYQLHQLYYAQDSYDTETQNFLRANGSLEAIENWFFIDVEGSIQQQTISPFQGVASPYVNTNGSNNSTETSFYRLTPYFKGVLGASTDYQMRFDVATSRNDENKAFDSDTKQWGLNLKGITGLASLGWGVDASYQDIEYGDGRSNEANTLRGILAYHVSPQFNLLLIGGHEVNDYLGNGMESSSIKGAGFEWSPTERTKLAATFEDRFFGNTNQIEFTHRTAGTAWRYSESEDATALSNEQTVYGLGTNYDLFYNLFASAIPDPAQRAAFVNAYLVANGVSPDAQLLGGYLNSGVALLHRRDFSFAITGARNTITLAASQTETSNLRDALGSGVLIGDNLAVFQKIEQRGVSVSWSHKLTPLSTLVAMAGRLKSEGSGTSFEDIDQTNYHLNFQTRLGPNTNFGVGARRIVVEGTTNYKENAVTGTLSHQF